MSNSRFDISVEKLEEIIYNAPWLLDERYIVPNIKGEKGNGRHISFSVNKDKYIKILFKDLRSNCPVIIDIINKEVEKTDIAQIMLYRAIFISATDESRRKIENEFGVNCNCPKLTIVAKSASQDALISANLAGIEIITYGTKEDIEINFGNLDKIDDKIQKWEEFRNSGEVTLEERDKWIEEIYYKFNDIISDMNMPNLSISKLYRTNAKYFWVEGVVFPFINVSFAYNDEYLIGIYEYFTEDTPYSNKSIYVDFIIPTLYYADSEDEKKNEALEKKIEQLITDSGYPIIKFNHGMATIKIKRAILTDNEELKAVINEIIKLAIEMIEMEV